MSYRRIGRHGDVDRPARFIAEALERRLLLAFVDGFNGTDVPIPDGGDWVFSTIDISGVPQDARITRVEAYFQIVHPFAGDLAVDLEAAGSPASYTLWDFEGEGLDNPARTAVDIHSFDGLSVNRPWYLYALDAEAVDSGYIDEWAIRIHYEIPTSFSPEFFDARIANSLDLDDDGYRSEFDIQWDVDSNIAGSYYVKVFERDALGDHFLVTSPVWPVAGSPRDYHGVTIFTDDHGLAHGPAEFVLELYDATTNVLKETWTVGHDPDLGNVLVELAGEDNRAPSAPVGIAAPLGDLNRTSAKIVWQPATDPDGDDISYEVEYGINNTPGWISGGVTTQSSITLTGLTEGKVYVVRVRTMDSFGASSSWVELDPAFRATSAPVIKNAIGGAPVPTATQETWVIFHGRGGMSWTAGDMIYELIQAVEKPTRQVLVVDWTGLSAADSDGDGAEFLDFGGEEWITSMADWTAATLTSWGFTGLNSQNLNFIGHSWGGVLSAETAGRIGSGINGLIALDPAQDAPPPFGTSYNTELVNFANVSQRAWAFYSRDDGIAGSEITPPTADESIVVRGSDHSEVVALFANMLKSPGRALSRWFGLDRLRDHGPGPWRSDQYNRDAGSPGPYEAVLAAKSGGLEPSQLSYIRGSDGTEVMVDASNILGDANGDGKIRIGDFLRIDRGFARGSTGFSNGDFDYSGVIDGLDYFIIDEAYLENLQAGQALAAAPPAGTAQSTALAGPDYRDVFSDTQVSAEFDDEDDRDLLASMLPVLA